MARTKKTEGLPAQPLEGVDLSMGPDKTVIAWKATRPLTVKEHESISAKLRAEAKATGLNILFVPYSVEVGDDAPEQ
ncbi:hypothetical protein [Cohnella sp.]|uniref:hypothetical protein n=1 Tax=Cohnella sp. TaxID=1883426 RepID=UPI00356A7169